MYFEIITISLEKHFENMLGRGMAIHIIKLKKKINYLQLTNNYVT